ncbi:DUF2304 domain-containing protein [Actinotignum urinale]|uniref:DUF2304 domain-containing protein n=1 Tax=Actinotignum urinale TaxID=190146 RepID=A0AAW9HUW2_9ACTO|nr:DUF2304 domain-containing protein [Actinotignum urinale]MDY5154140.1 DUF2304 domain-containing protein [Actinotignum urinale]
MTYIIYRSLPIIASIFFLIFLFLLLRSRKMKQTYVYIWFVIGLALMFISIWPASVFYTAWGLGFEKASNFILVCACVVLLLVSIQLSTSVSKLEEDRRKIVEEIAILEARVHELEKEKIQEEGLPEQHFG